MTFKQYLDLYGTDHDNDKETRLALIGIELKKLGIIKSNNQAIRRAPSSEQQLLWFIHEGHKDDF